MSPRSVDALLDEKPVLVSVEKSDTPQKFKLTCLRPDNSKSILEFGDVEAMDLIEILNQLLKQ